MRETQQPFYPGDALVEGPSVDSSIDSRWATREWVVRCCRRNHWCFDWNRRFSWRQWRRWWGQGLDTQPYRICAMGAPDRPGISWGYIAEIRSANSKATQSSTTRRHSIRSGQTWGARTKSPGDTCNRLVMIPRCREVVEKTVTRPDNSGGRAGVGIPLVDARNVRARERRVQRPAPWFGESPNAPKSTRWECRRAT